ncbi:MAG TPA: hypothetical protein VH189_11205 [Rhizomicrobium sp.]|nr:hypothetical protein [Rhizomicrobium sp.]
MNTQGARLKPSRASLIGGIVVGVAAFVLCLAATSELGFHGAPAWGASLVVAVATGVWTRLADL